MALGRQLPIEQRDEGGVVTTRLMPREAVGGSYDRDAYGEEGPGALPDLRRHYTLWPGYTDENPLKIIPGRSVRVDAGGALFEKYEVVVRDAQTIYLGFDREVDNEAGTYDDIVTPAMASRSDRCEPATFMTLFFGPGHSATSRVEVFLYAGRMAEPS